MLTRKKIAVVTGAHGSIGSALVTRLKKEGIKCISIDKDIYFPYYTPFDFSNEKDPEFCATYIWENFDKVDYLFNVAGIGIYKSIKRLSIDEWLDSVAINMTAPFILIKKLLPLLRKSSKPLVLNIGSGMGIFPTEKRSAYCASKFGLRGLSLSLSKEIKDVDISLLTLGSVMNNFGTDGIEARQKKAKKGKRYLEVYQVVDKIMEIVQSNKRKAEYILYPEGYEQ